MSLTAGLDMASSEDIIRIGRKLEKATTGNDVSGGAILDLLKTLQSYDMNLELLQKTRIGMKVNSVRKKSDSEEVVTLAKSLVKGWKKLLDAKVSSKKSESENGDGTGMDDEDSCSMSQDQSSQSTGSTPTEGQTDIEETPQQPQRTDSSDSNSQFPTATATADEMRLKYRSMLVDALRTDGSEIDEEYLRSLAGRIEEAAKTIHRGTDKKYMACLRSRIFNLKDKKNPELRSNVLLGLIAPERLAAMTPEEMASKTLRKERQDITKSAIKEHQLAFDTGTPTNLFTCGKCKGKNCTYTQAQTRSADEPMTTFVLCQQCGNRWKFC